MAILPAMVIDHSTRISLQILSCSAPPTSAFHNLPILSLHRFLPLLIFHSLKFLGPHCIPDATLTMSSSELACAYAALALYDDGIAITADKIAAVVAAAGLCVESYWPSLFAKLAEKRDIGDLLLNVGCGGGAAAPVSVAASAGGASASAAATAVEEKKEEPKEESDDDMGFSLFD